MDQVARGRGVDGVLTHARAVRDVARRVRTEAVASRWRSSGTRLTTTDIRVELVWTVFQMRQVADGERGRFVLLRDCRQPACGVEHCGRLQSPG